MFSKLLIANRGEIACRVIRTARRLGIATVAVYSEADARALHVEMADEAYRIGPAPAAESYLRIDRILDAAIRSGAEAIHPGYGFLSENPRFAETCARAGLVFVGPPPDAIRAMGSKSEAKARMERAGVPLVPGYHGADQDPETLAREADRIGYPVLIKASSGGGGKGMRIVESRTEFAAGLESARREAKAAFGDDQVLIERYLPRPRHVEIQVFADSHSNCIHLFERDCSFQRRHQKVVEEAPAPGLSPAIRAAMGEAAVRAARAVGYRGAGTVEFLLGADQSFYFMEMNTRLQVEHPVTEAVTGIDLVEWQLREAAGEPLPLDQPSLAMEGHAIEVRLYAEDPANGFLPSAGRLAHVRLPQGGDHVRVDTGVRAGDRITVHYDPLLAKLIVRDRDRPSAVRRLIRALEETEIVGVAANTGFLAAIARHPAFAAGEVDTGFIDRHRGELVAAADAGIGPDALALAALYLLLDRRREEDERALRSGDPWSPWWHAWGWRLNGGATEALRLRAGDRMIEIAIDYLTEGAFRLVLPDGTVTAGGDLASDGTLMADLDGVRCRATVLRNGRDLSVLALGRRTNLQLVDTVADTDQEVAPGGLIAAMPGKVVAVSVARGDRVRKGQPLLVLETMKMEHTVTAPADGIVTRLDHAVGDQVQEGMELIGFDAER